MRKKYCLHCKNEFCVKDYRFDTAFYCSRECKHKHKRTTVRCKECGKEFECPKSISKRTKFCSKQCQSNYGTVGKKCEFCNKKFNVPNSRMNAKYCSKECLKKDSDIWTTCKICGKEFVRKQWQVDGAKKRSLESNFCSKKCYENRSPKIEVSCGKCGKKFQIYPSRHRYYSSYFCSKSCLTKFGYGGKITTRKIDSNNYQKFVRKIRHTAAYYSWRKSCLERDGNECVVCKSKNRLTVHHEISMFELVKKYGFDKEAILDDGIFNNPDNGKTMCRPCHAKEHRQ